MNKRERTRWFLKEWRKHRGLTQQQLADRVETTKSVISTLENGGQRWNQDLVEALAEALSCDPVDLLIRDPSAPEPIWSIWDRVPAVNRDQALRVLEAMAQPPKTTSNKPSKKAS